MSLLFCLVCCLGKGNVAVIKYQLFSVPHEELCLDIVCHGMCHASEAEFAIGAQYDTQ